MIDRPSWQDPPDAKVGWYYDGDGVEFVLSEYGLKVAVTEEQAVGGYNQTFTCEWMIPLERAKALLDWLNEVLPE